MDYKKKYEEALKRARLINNGEVVEAENGTSICEAIFPELKESKDEKIKKALIDLVKCNERSGYMVLNNVSTGAMIAWLEKQKPTTWSEEDEKKRQETIDWFENKCFPYALEHENPARESIKWLKSLKPQPKQEWSEEDEEMFNNIIEEDLMPYGECPDYPTEEEREYYYNRQDKVDWLKSLKERIN